MANTKKIFQELVEVKKHSYSRYSKFSTAAIVETDKGFFKGVNVENSSFGATMCSERVAIFNAITHGARKFKALYGLSGSKREDIVPCGMCLQVMAEFFEPNTPIYYFNILGKCKKYLFKDLLPHYFNEIQLYDKKTKSKNKTK